jgi:23S rRNA (cytidine1920-2'-O)/16S rRNA (cytidine1409-2'-O)-methyltransferase
VAKPHRARFVALVELLARMQPPADEDAILDGRVLVDGRVVSNAHARVRADASIRVQPARRLRGDRKLSHALDTLDVAVSGRVAIDIGASAGGFTTALIARGAARVYAVDAGIGQLVGWLRVDPRVVNLEGTNLGALDAAVVPDVVELVTIDVSYLALADAVPQLDRIHIAEAVDLVALVKPTFELRRRSLAASDEDVTAAVESVHRAFAIHGWTVVETCDAPRTGRRGAREAFVHARLTRDRRRPAFPRARGAAR